VIQERLAARNAGTIRISAENPFGALLEFPIGRDERGASSAYHRLIIFENSWVDHRGATANATREFIHPALVVQSPLQLIALHHTIAQVGTRPSITLPLHKLRATRSIVKTRCGAPSHLADSRRAFRYQPIQRAS